MLVAPGTLFHYTSGEGLLGILRSKTIWASHLRFLNDARELQYGLDLLVPHFREHIRKRVDGRWAELLVDQFVDALKEASLYVACFCESGDLLSQWRGYARGGGFALGFDTAAVASLGQPVQFERVIYEQELGADLADRWARMMAESFVAAFNTDFMDATKARDGAGDIPESHVEEFAKRIYEFHTGEGARAAHAAAHLKDPAFSEEREWRILGYRGWHGNYGTPPEFRVGDFGLTPYIEIDLSTSEGRLPLREIVVGPGPHALLRVEATQLRLSSLGYGAEEVAVRTSNIPFRH